MCHSPLFYLYKLIHAVKLEAYGEAVVRVDSNIFRVAKLQKAAVAFQLFAVILSHIVRAEKHPAEEAVDGGENILLPLAEFQIVVAQEEHIRVIQPCPAIELAAEDAVENCVPRGNALTVNQAHDGRIVPIKADITAYAAVVKHPEGGHERHAAAENELIAAHFAQQLHGARHPRGAALPVSAEGRGGIQKVELHKVIAPVVQHPVETEAQIIYDLRIVDIERVEAAPV